MGWSYLPTPPLGQDMTQGQFFKWSLIGLNSEFSFSKTSCLTKAEEPSLSYYLPIAGGRIIGFIPFPRVLVLCEMQSASSRIWTRVAVFKKVSYGVKQNNQPTHRLGATTLDQSEPGSDANEGILRIPRSSSVTGTSPLACLLSYLEHTLWRGV